jgi:hypothetical protein
MLSKVYLGKNENHKGKLKKLRKKDTLAFESCRSNNRLFCFSKAAKKRKKARMIKGGTNTLQNKPESPAIARKLSELYLRPMYVLN